jgi:hypothetical protein
LLFPGALKYTIISPAPETFVAFKLIPKGEIRTTQQKPPHIAISPHGRFCLSTVAVELLTREYSYEYVFLFWDQDSKLIAIRPTKRKDDRAYRITYSSSGRNAAIAGRSFCEVIGYDYSRTRSFLVTWKNAEPEFLLDLNSEMFKSIKGKRGPQPIATGAGMSETELATWYTKKEACERLRISKRSLERIVKDGGIDKLYRRCPGRMSEPVFNPRDVDAVARKPVKTG